MNLTPFRCHSTRRSNTRSALRNSSIAAAEARKASVIADAGADAVRAEGDAQAAAIQAVGEAEASAIKAKGFADAESIERRAQALATNSEAVVLQEIAENYPAIVANAAKAFENVGSMQVLNGAEGVTEMVTSVIGQGLAGLNAVKGMLDKPAAPTTVATPVKGSPAPAVAVARTPKDAGSA